MLRHVPRVHRVNIDATYERIREDPGIYLRHWPTEYQMADILTKGSFTQNQWVALLDLAQLRLPTKQTNGSVSNNTQKDAKALPPIPSFPILLDDNRIIESQTKKKKKRKPSSLGVEGGAGGLAFMASGKYISRRLYYASAAVALSLGVQGIRVPFSAMASSSRDDSSWNVVPQRSEANALPPRLCRVGETSRCERLTATSAKMVGKGWAHSNTGCLTMDRSELSEWCLHAEERADAEAIEIISQAAAVSGKRSEC